MKMKTFNMCAHRAWRRKEAYGVPMTEEGMRKAAERFEAYEPPFVDGLLTAATILENMHRENKKDHSFYLKASRRLRELAEREEPSW